MLSSALALALLAFSSSSGVDALPWDGPAKTAPIENVLGWSPKPTQAPFVGNELAPAPMGLGPLEERQLGFSTCGWVSKLYKYSFTCYSTNVCVTNRQNNAQGCLPYRNDRYRTYFIPTACVASTALSAICDLGCAEDPFTTHCIYKEYPECYTAYFDYGSRTLSYVGCTKPKLTPFTVYMSYTNKRTTNTPYSVSATNYITGWTGSPYLFYTPPSLSAKYSDSTSTSSSSSSVPAPVSVHSHTQTQIHSHPSKHGGGNTPSQNSGDSSGGGTPVGAIVGGVIGGIAVICICVAVIVFLCLRSRRKPATPDPATGSAPQYPQQPMSQTSHGNYSAEGTYLSPGYMSPNERPTSGNAANSTVIGGSPVGPPAYPVEADSGNDASTLKHSTHPAYSSPKIVEADSGHVMTNPEGRPVHEVP